MVLIGNITYEMMANKNMTRADQIGVPKDPIDPSQGLVWKDIFSLTEEDFEAIEAYFKNHE